MFLLGEIMIMHLLLGSFVCVNGEFDNVYNAKNYLVGS
jgi:hypothetical protein